MTSLHETGGSTLHAGLQFSGAGLEARLDIGKSNQNWKRIFGKSESYYSSYSRSKKPGRSEHVRLDFYNIL